MGKGHTGISEKNPLQSWVCVCASERSMSDLLAMHLDLSVVERYISLNRTEFKKKNEYIIQQHYYSYRKQSVLT